MSGGLAGIGLCVVGVPVNKTPQPRPRAGELVVRGKTRRQDRLPLPADVGEALAGYLTRARRPQIPGGYSLPARLPLVPGRRVW